MGVTLRSVLFSLVFTAAAAVQAAPQKPAPAPAASSAGLTGQYALEGATEVGSMLALRPDGTYRWMMSYGNQDLSSAGVWVAKGDRVVLTAKREPLKFRLFTEDELNLKKDPKPGVWVAIVGVPRQGPVADVEVRFEAKSGKTAVATSLPNGDAIVDMPASEAWVRAGLRAKGSTEAYQVLAVPAARGKARIAAFAIENVDALQNGFVSMELSQEKGALVPAGESAMRGRYVKQSAD